MLYALQSPCSLVVLLPPLLTAMEKIVANEIGKFMVGRWFCEL